MLSQQIGNYKFLSLLGEGGMAKVYLAENTMLGSKVAIKVLKDEFVHNKNIRSRFLDEARKMVSVKHPNIVQVYDLLDTGSTVAIVMEYVDGTSLKELIKSKGKLAESEIKRMLPEMLKTLQHIHNAGFVHRDIKPSNFLLNVDGTVKLADFGIAKALHVDSQDATITGTQMGTPMYMSPEQIKSTKDVDNRSDIYSLGVVLFEMVTGKKPYDGDQISLYNLQTKIINEDLPLTRTTWDKQIQRATAKDVENRFQSCNLWLQSLEKVTINIDDTIFTTEPPPRPPVDNPTPRKPRSMFWPYFFGFLVVFGIAGFLLVNYMKSQNEHESTNNGIQKLTNEELKGYGASDFEKIIKGLNTDTLDYMCDGCDINFLVNDTVYKLTYSENEKFILNIDKFNRKEICIHSPESNLRQEPNSNSNIMGIFKRGDYDERLVIERFDGKQSRWAFIKRKNGQEGYLEFKQYCPCYLLPKKFQGNIKGCD
jgi:serine/threonine protein kinase